MNKIKLWKERNYSDTGYLYLKTDNKYVKGIIGKDIELTLWQKIQILFCRGISVTFVDK